jgi:hypothetical protein
MQDDMFQILEEASERHRTGRRSDLREWRQRWELSHIAEVFAKFVSVEECGTLLSDQAIQRCVDRFFEITGR